MPQTVICSECNEVLYDSETRSSGKGATPMIVSPVEIIEKYDGRCPKCNKRLEIDYKDGITIY